MASGKTNMKNYEFFATKEGGSLFSGNQFVRLECTEDESGESSWKRGRTREWVERRNQSGM